ncbi:MAG TPA: purine-nucleoside phosphorylase [Actinomycetota bacterium]|nr:purine-nucleoside phosphorylase [Actinomycetota bacterium]
MSGGPAAAPDRLAESAAAVVRTRSVAEPRVGIVLGSGLGPALGDALRIDDTIPYADLPGFPAITVPGHVGELVLGELVGVSIAGFRGRFHLYEGHDAGVPALLPRLARALGAETMVLTAAVGAVVPDLAAGTVVILRDHLNFSGSVPLMRWRFADGSPAFVTGRVYDSELRALALERATEIGVVAAEGVYGAMRGPAYETPAEVEMLARAGATVVGMSMVPESLPAHALGMRVLGICSLTNALGEPVTHEDVLRVSHETAAAIGRLLVDLLPRLPRKELQDG